MDIVTIKNKKLTESFKIDKEIEKIIGKNEKAIKAFMEEVTKSNTLGNHINLIKLCQIPAGLEERPEYTIMENYCETFKKCSLYLDGSAPVGCNCPYEVAYVYQTTQALYEELSIEVATQTVERMMMEDFIMYNLQKYRIQKVLAVGNMLVNSLEVTKLGTNYKKEVNPLLGQLPTLDKMIDSIRKRLIADRESKLKFGLESAKVKTDQAKVKMLKEMDSKTKVNKSNKLGLLEKDEDEDDLGDLDFQEVEVAEVIEIK